jgi:hypothetical protein
MGATLIIRGTRQDANRATWMPQTGTFEFILQHIAIELDTVNPILASMLRAPIGGFPYLDLSELNQQEFQILGEATIRAHDQLLKTGTLSGSVALFPELKMLVMLDSRFQGLMDVSGTIEVQKGVLWVAPGWIYDFVLEVIVTDRRVFSSYPKQVAELISSRVWEGNSYLNLSTIDFGIYVGIWDAIYHLYGFYGDGLGKFSYGLQHREEVGIHISKFFNLAQEKYHADFKAQIHRAMNEHHWLLEELSKR